MAQRPVYIPVHEKSLFVKTELVDFTWSLYMSVFKQSLLVQAISSKESFLDTIKNMSISNARQNETNQPGFGF
ncbi:hypothetical protein KAM622c_40920 [Klebsiella quasipneumoniae subsp. quasipneumoniae]|nr:hypothetical protein KAM622c_40920 [Klebsiella quasipneumoniae subsp. quasipneumoniae]